MFKVICAKNIMLWVLPTASKRAPVGVICFILTTLWNERQPCRFVIIDEDSALEKSTYIKSLLVDRFKISMETAGGDASWINGKNERHNRRIHNMVRAALLDINKHLKK